jgi:RNA methyltransferase, TrmH family
MMISSSQNALVKRVRRLRQKKYREAEGAFFAEGLHVVLTAVEQRAPLEAILYAPDLLDSPAAYEMIRQQQINGVRCEAITAELFSSLSPRDNPIGLGAIIRWQETRLEAFVPTPHSRYLALHEIADPGNLGTNLRTADALGLAGVILIGQTTEPTHPSAVKASMGTIFTVPTAVAPDLPTFWQWAKQHNLHTIATTAHAPQPCWQAHYPTPLVILMGSEKFGLPAEALAQASQQVSIPMHGHATSLNLSIATAMILYEATRGDSYA